jgi:UDP-N-acetylmuramoyl-L-alanyl-D-glutamate--2,6-diaminopimelate ligase
VSSATVILDALEAAGLLAGPVAPVPALTGIATDSRAATAGTLFCAVEGTVADGHAYLDDAARRGAVAALVARPVPDVAIPQVLVTDSRRAAAVAAAAWFGWPARALRLVGVTGTNGKSTTVALVRHLLNAQGDAGALGTLGAFDGTGAPVPGGSALTTPGPVDLQHVLAQLRARGVRTVAMETSSHALHQGRVYGLQFAAGVYTNLTHEHLDYHGDLDAYLAAKALLSEYLTPDGVEIVNADDPAWTKLPRRPRRRRVTFGVLQPAEVHATDLSFAAGATRFRLHLGDRGLQVELPLMGEFNVSNALGAATAAWALGLPPDAVVDRLATAPQVPGRLERLAAEPFVVLRDYAHTPDALRRVLRTLRSQTPGRLIVLFGAGGDRDRRKRPVMGQVAAQEADLTIISTDNPRTEDPERILDEIEEGLSAVAHLRITDRHEAIERALELARPGDTLLLAGKGHETYQVYGTEKVPFDEAAIVRDALAARR